MIRIAIRTWRGQYDNYTTVIGRQGRQKIIPPKNVKPINKFNKYFVEINKNEVNRNHRQKTKRKRLAASKIQC